MEACPGCGGKCACGAKCQCGSGMGRGGMGGGKMEMWMHMPKEVKIAKLEKKEAIMKAELDFVSKMKEMVKNKPETKE